MTMEIRIKCKTIEDLECLMDMAWDEMAKKLEEGDKNMSTVSSPSGSYMVDPSASSEGGSK